LKKQKRIALTKKERQEELKKYQGTIGERGGAWYIMGNDEMVEEFNIKRLEVKVGGVFLAVLPREDSGLFFFKLFVHYDVGADGGSFVCANQMWDEDCPVCNYRDELIREGEPKEVTDDLKPTRRNLLLVVNVKDKRTIRDGVQLYDAPTMVVDGIVNQCTDERSGDVLDITDFEEGRNVIFKRTGKDMRTRYTSFKIEDLVDDVPEEYYDDLPVLEEFIIKPDAKEIERLLGTSKKSKGKKRRQNVSYEDDDADGSYDKDDGAADDDDIVFDDGDDVPFDEDDGPADEETEEESKPKKTSHRRSRKSRTVDEEEEEAEEEDDDSARDKKRAKSNVKSKLRKSRRER